MRFLKLGRNAKSGKDTWWMIQGVDTDGCALLMSLEVCDLGWFEMPGVFSATQLAQDHAMEILDELVPDEADRDKLQDVNLRFEVKGVHHSFTDKRPAIAYCGVRNFEEFEGEVYAFDAARKAWEYTKKTEAGMLSSKCDPANESPARSMGSDALPQGMRLELANAASNSSYCDSGLRFSFDNTKMSERFYVTRYTGAPHMQVNRVAMRIAVMTAPGELGKLTTYTQAEYVTSLKLARALKELEASEKAVRDAEDELDRVRIEVEDRARENSAAKVEREQQRARDEIARAKEDIDHAGIFGFGKKRQLRAEIEELEAKIAEVGEAAEQRAADAVEHAVAHSEQLSDAKKALAERVTALEKARELVHSLDQKLGGK